MAGPKVRRVVTGHNPDGMAIIQMDEIAQGERFTLIWTTEGFPVDNTDERDGGHRDVGITLNAAPSSAWVRSPRASSSRRGSGDA
jgi:hypothetical protein